MDVGDKKMALGYTCETEIYPTVLMVLAWLLLSGKTHLLNHSYSGYQSVSHSPTGTLNSLLSPMCDFSHHSYSGHYCNSAFRLSLFSGSPWAFPNDQPGCEEGVRGWWRLLKPAARASNFSLKLSDLCSDHGHSVWHGIRTESSSNKTAQDWPTGLQWNKDVGIVSWLVCQLCIFVLF